VRPAATFAGVLLTCQSGFETLLARELVELNRGVVRERGPGWVLTEGEPEESAFAHLGMIEPVEFTGESVNALAGRIAEFFFVSLRSERIEAPWPNLWQGPAEMVGLGRRIGAVEMAFGALLKRKLSRIAKLGGAPLPRGVSRVRGLFVFFPDFRRVFVAREAIINGQRRMADDELAPSRSYLKVEEAYQLLGQEPGPGEIVCDLGAAPGGWSYSAAKRGARVIALDNGPLKGGALNHPQIEHRREDAFGFRPASVNQVAGSTPSGEMFDWLLCDLVEEPHHVMRQLVSPWLEHRWCRRFIVNLKFGRVDPIGLLAELRAPDGPLARLAPGTLIRHLYHDREEFTLVGKIRE